MNYTEQQLIDLEGLLPLTNREQDGVDSTKRAAAIRMLAGKADGMQTNRLLVLAIAFTRARMTG